jgi:hypothetical protein
MVGVAVGEVGFLIARSAGLRWLEIVSVCVGVVIVAAAMWWVVRDGRHLRAAGHKPDFGQLEHRMRRHLKQGLVWVALSVITTVAGDVTCRRSANVVSWDRIDLGERGASWISP